VESCILVFASLLDGDDVMARVSSSPAGDAGQSLEGERRDERAWDAEERVDHGKLVHGMVLLYVKEVFNPRSGVSA